jgi:hypothetical protein
MLDFFQVVVPGIALMINVIAQFTAALLRPRAGFVRSVLIGFAAGLISLWALGYLIHSYQSDPPPEEAAILLVNTATYIALAYCFFAFLNLGKTSVRIRIFSELQQSRHGLTAEEVLALYNYREIVELRLDRLLNSKQVTKRDGRYFLDGRLLWSLALAVRSVKRLLLGKISEFERGDAAPSPDTDRRAQAPEASRPANHGPAGTRLTALVLCILSSLYVALFIPVNLLGAKNVPMLSAVSCDEVGEYQLVNAMTTREDSFWGTLKNFFCFDRHIDQVAYGFPFWSASALAIVPVKILHKAGFIDEANMTTANLLVLRELNPLFLSLAIVSLVYLWTGFKSVVRSVMLFLFLASIPVAFWLNIQNWHPDDLLVLFVVLTILALVKDALRFGKCFCLAAVFCGLATGTKMLGLWFFFCIAMYLLLGRLTGRWSVAGVDDGGVPSRSTGLASTWHVVKQGAVFLAIMVLTVVASNPLLLTPDGAGMYFRGVTNSITQGPWERTLLALDQGETSTPELLLLYEQTLRENCGFWWFYVLLVCICVFCVRYDSRHRLANIVILAWVLPFAVYLVSRGLTTQSHYFLPLILPLASCIANPALWDLKSRYSGPRVIKVALLGASIVLGGNQWVHYTQTNASCYETRMRTEEENPSLVFYRKLDEEYLSKRPDPDGHVRVLIDAPYSGIFFYVPPVSRLRVRGGLDQHGLLNYGLVDEWQPGLILVGKENTRCFGQAAAVGALSPLLGPELGRTVVEFYGDARWRQVRGYHVVLETDYAVAFEKDP